MSTARDTARRIHQEYAGDNNRPLRGYLVAMGVYGAVTGGLAAIGKLTGARLPARWSAGDVAMLATATFMGSRLVSKDAITSPLRAPFARYEQPAGDGELNESVRGHGTRHAVGELITCPFCLAVWVATGLGAGLVVAPKTTRLVTMVLTAVAASDAAQLAYDSMKKLAEG